MTTQEAIQKVLDHVNPKSESDKKYLRSLCESIANWAVLEHTYKSNVETEPFPAPEMLIQHKNIN